MVSAISPPLSASFLFQQNSSHFPALVLVTLCYSLLECHDYYIDWLVPVVLWGKKNQVKGGEPSYWNAKTNGQRGQREHVEYIFAVQTC